MEFFDGSIKHRDKPKENMIEATSQRAFSIAISSAVLVACILAVFVVAWVQFGLRFAVMLGAIEYLVVTLLTFVLMSIDVVRARRRRMHKRNMQSCR